MYLLLCRIHLLLSNPDDIPWGITDQATFWKDLYTTNTDSMSKEEFRTKVEGYETGDSFN